LKIGQHLAWVSTTLFRLTIANGHDYCVCLRV